ncbi:MAG: hypothetical protein AB7U34_00515 [Novosphingobium sp.]
MTKYLSGGALALPFLLSAAPALAHSEGPAAIARPDGHAPAGVMVDHVHKSGDVMIGLAWMRETYEGPNHTGTRKATDAEIAAAGYSARARSMTMDMVMGHLMWAPSDRVTLMAMPMWMRMKMTMLGIGSMDAAMDHMASGHHSLMPGETMSHTVSGMGDTKLGALVALSRKPALSAHVGLMVSAPTGSVSKTNTDGSFVHYGMQPGSGTWDFEPSLTVKGQGDVLGWGLQASYVTRLENRNESGYRLGDRFAATGWASARVHERVSLSARLAFSDEGHIHGHYNAAHSHTSPADRQENYGGQRLEAGLGANVTIGKGLRAGVEAIVPLWQDVNGYQLTKDAGVNVALSHAF